MTSNILTMLLHSSKSNQNFKFVSQMIGKCPVTFSMSHYFRFDLSSEILSDMQFIRLLNIKFWSKFTYLKKSKKSLEKLLSELFPMQKTIRDKIFFVPRKETQRFLTLTLAGCVCQLAVKWILWENLSLKWHHFSYYSKFHFDLLLKSEILIPNVWKNPYFEKKIVFWRPIMNANFTQSCYQDYSRSF